MFPSLRGSGHIKVTFRKIFLSLFLAVLGLRSVLGLSLVAESRAGLSCSAWASLAVEHGL